MTRQYVFSVLSKLETPVKIPVEAAIDLMRTVWASMVADAVAGEKRVKLSP